MTTTPAPVPPSTASALDRFFDGLRRSPVRRSREGAVAGVCSGVAERLGVSTAIVRVATVVGALLLPVAALYLAAWLLLPDADGRIRLEGAVRRGEASSIVLLVLAVVAALPDAGVHDRVPFGLVAVGLLVVAAFVVGSRRRRGQDGGGSGAAPWSAPSGHSAPTGYTAPTAPAAGPTATGPASGSWPQDSH